MGYLDAVNLSGQVENFITSDDYFYKLQFERGSHKFVVEQQTVSEERW